MVMGAHQQMKRAQRQNRKPVPMQFRIEKKVKRSLMRHQMIRLGANGQLGLWLYLLINSPLCAVPRTTKLLEGNFSSTSSHFRPFRPRGTH